MRLTIKKESVTVVPSVENKLALRITLILSLYIHTVQRGMLKKNIHSPMNNSDTSFTKDTLFSKDYCM